MSVTAWLLNNLDGRIVLSVPKAAQARELGTLEFDDIEPRLGFLPGGRHERIDQALEKCERWKLKRPKRIFVQVRPAYDLIRSYYQYAQRPRVAKRMQKGSVLAKEARLAAEGSLSEFAAKSTFMGKSPATMMEYYQMISTDVRLDIVPLEHSGEYLNMAFKQHHNCGRLPLPRRNSSKREHNYDAEAAEIIADRFGNLQKVYDTAVANWPSLVKKF